MKISKEEIQTKEVAGHTKNGNPVIYIETVGGLHGFFAKDEDGNISALGLAPHKEIGRFFAQKKDPDIVWSNSFLSKSESNPEQEMFDKLRNFLFLKTEPIEQNPQDVYVVYNTNTKEVSLVKHEEIHENLSKMDEYSLIRDLACTEGVQLLKDIKDRFLEKMSRPRITFPNLLPKDTRPDQDVQLIETDKQKKMYGRKVANDHYRDKKIMEPQFTQHPDWGHLVPTGEQKERVMSQQVTRDVASKKIAGAFSRSLVGVNHKTNNQSFQSALAGKARSKYEKIKDTGHDIKLAEHSAKKASLLRDYQDKLGKWVNTPYPERGDRPMRPKMPRTPSKPRVDTKDLSPEDMKHRGNSVDATVEHEGFHGLMDKIGKKYGEPAVSRITDKLLLQHNRDAITEVGTYIAARLKYKPKSPSFKEEILAHARDILVNPKKREDFVSFLEARKINGRDIVNKLKAGHSKAHRYAQALSAADVQSEQAPAQQTPAAAEKITKGEKLVHFSPMENLIEIDPSKMGTSGVGGMQYKRGLPENKSSFFYSNASEPESLVTQKAPHKYEAELEDHHKIYDFKNDPEQLVQEQKARNGGAYNEDLLHGIIKEKGYHGVKWMMNPKTTVFQMYSPMKVKKV